MLLHLNSSLYCLSEKGNNSIFIKMWVIPLCKSCNEIKNKYWKTNLVALFDLSFQYRRNRMNVLIKIENGLPQLLNHLLQLLQSEDLLTTLLDCLYQTLFHLSEEESKIVHCWWGKPILDILAACCIPTEKEP